MIDGKDAVRTTEDMDPVFEHLRKQDAAIEAMNARLDGFSESLQFLVLINQNLEGFSNFCCKWGARANRICKWTATVAAPIITIYILCKDSIDAFFKRWFG